MLISAAGGYPLQSSAMGQISAQIADRQHASAAAVLATTGLNLLNYGSSAVARGTS